MLVSPSRGVPRILYYVLILCHLGSIAKAELLDSPLLAPSVSPFPQWKPAGDELPPPVRFPPVHRRHRKHFALPPEAEAAPRPNFGSFSVDGHPPSGSSHLARPSMRRSQFAAPSFALVPSAMGPNDSSVPSGSAQPPLSPHVSGCCEPHMVQRRGSRDCHCVYPIILELYLYNVSLSSNWSDVFLEELASQLGLKVTQFQITNFYVVGVRGLNISMDLAPHTGISFPANEVYKMNYSLSMHMIRVDPNLVGDYRLLNLTWFKPPAPSPAPAVALSPFSLPRSQSSQQASTDADSGKHQNLIVIIGIGAGILIIIVIFVLAICLCASRVGKKTVTVKETVKPRSVDALSVEGSLPHPASTRFLAYEELKEATNNFEAGSVLGEGGFGRVFKGVLSDGTAVAIKKLTNGGHQGDKEFLVEVEMLSRLHHRNLVKLVGYYSSRDASQHLLCYELVPNGSLEAWLHGMLSFHPIM
ncbi:Proline-rich receptor-like protein kinase PERK3 [Acorus calamus]|uniref:Proline-rich receptor-like protein kinase PERK3 n=1 Tax=Acorus calamus TaxID=4465 RepID=A0AAV9EXK0_ACOCL|nr:Proline-rich receptor-like protein kinase PERK3 [Acorus calamus]